MRPASPPLDAPSPLETRTSPARPRSHPAHRPTVRAFGAACVPRTEAAGPSAGIAPPRARSSGRSAGGEGAVGVSAALHAPGASAALRRRLGPAALPGGREEGCPGESCQGNLSNLSAPVPASCIIHGRRRQPRRRDAGAAHLHQPAEAGHLAGTLRDPGARPATPGAYTGCAGPGLPEPAAPAARTWTGAPGTGTQPGVAGSLGTLRLRGGSPPSARPLAAPRPRLRGACRPRSPRRRAAT